MNEIKDLVEVSEHSNANIPQLILDAYNRGLNEGYRQTKEKAIETLQEKL